MLGFCVSNEEKVQKDGEFWRQQSQLTEEIQPPKFRTFQLQARALRVLFTPFFRSRLWG